MSYTQLPTDSLGSEEDKPFLPNFTPTSVGKSSSWSGCLSIDWLLVAAAIGISATFFNVLLLNTSVLHLSQAPPISTRHPNTYIGLDQIVRNESSPDWPRTRHEFPGFLITVDSQEPNASPSEARRVRLDNTHIVIAQYSVRDFGLESCSLASYFPEISHDSLDRYTWNGQAETLDVWLLDNNTPLSSPTRRFSWSTKPARVRFLGTLNATTERDIMPFFHCPSGSTQLFEISCGAGICDLSFLQLMPGPKIGFEMIQSEVQTF